MAYKCKGPYGPDFGAKTLGNNMLCYQTDVIRMFWKVTATCSLITLFFAGKGKSWHPGVKGHKLRADSFTYFMSSILSSALTNVSDSNYVLFCACSHSDFDLCNDGMCFCFY